MVVLPETEIGTAEKVAERIRRSVASKPFNAGPGCQLNITISAGVAALGGVEDSVEAIQKRADQALYRAKHEGRNRVMLAA